MENNFSEPAKSVRNFGHFLRTPGDRVKKMSRFLFGTAKPSPSITGILTETFGVAFGRASTDQKLALIECVAFLMRQSDYSLRDAIAAIEPSVKMPSVIALSNFKLESFKEGLILLALLYGGVNRDCGGVSEDS